MTLAQHLFIISIFPLSFLGLLVFLWFSESQHPITRRRWAVTLLLAALWSSVILRFHVGQTVAGEVIYGWGVVANYLLSLTALGLLLATTSYLSIPRPQRATAVVVVILLLIAALLLDVHLWGYYLGSVTVVGQPIDQFDLWIAVWIASWWMAAFAALIMALQKKADAPNSLYRNQINYWLIVLILFIVGGSIASVQQNNRPIYQEIGVLLILPAAILGTICIARSQMPDLQLTVRRLLNRLSGTLIVFGLTWVVLSFLTQGLADLPPGLSHNLLLVLAAFLFTGLFIVVYRVVNQLTRRIFLPALTRQDGALSDYTNAVGNLPEPEQLGQLLLRRIEANLTTRDGCCFLAESGPGGRLLLRPLTTTPTLDTPTAATFAADSPFANYLRQSRMPLAQYDIDSLAQFAALPDVERASLKAWGTMLYLPLRAGDTLVGMVALGDKESGEAYETADLGWLVALANQIGPVLAQARHLASLRQVNEYVFAQNQALVRQQQHLHALVALQREFIGLISPDLKQSLPPPDQSAAPIDKLIQTANRIQKRTAFHFESVHLDAIISSVLHNLNTMAEARRIVINYNMARFVPDIYADESQLREAVHSLLHNAIKFNKIGGQISIDCYLDGSNICLRIADSGVGIRPDRLPHIWSGLEQLPVNGSGGLGLKLAQFVVAAHGGHINVESSYGSGSVFTIYLPLALVEDVQQRAPKPA
jgi:signal transduction histidine kinase